MGENKGFFMRGVIIDFLILTLVFFAVCYAGFAASKLLYQDNKRTGEMTLITEAIPSLYEESITENDVVYDPITKRKVGKIDECQSIAEENNKIRFIIKISAENTPRTDSLRTKKLWFRYTVTE